MTVTVETVSDTATADGVLTSFPFTFELLQAADLDVYIDDVLTAFGYIVEINENGTGGDVIFDDPPEDGAELLFLRNVDITQETALPVEGNLPESTLETMADKLTMICQQIQSTVARMFSVALSAAGEVTSFVFPPPGAGELIRWNAAGDALESVTAAEMFADEELGGGNVFGPASATNRGIALFDGTTGKILKDGPIGTTGQILKGVTGSNPAFVNNSPDFTSDDVEIGDSVLHGLGAVPSQVWFALVCQEDDGGYAEGDVIFDFSHSTSDNSGVTIKVNTTEIEVIPWQSSDEFTVVDGTNQGFVTLDTAKWLMRIFANR